MKWFSHLVIAWAVGAPFGASPAVLLGATAPDWLESFGAFRHREETPQLCWWLLLFVVGGLFHFLSAWGWNLLWFAAGGLLLLSFFWIGPRGLEASSQRFNCFLVRARWCEAGQEEISLNGQKLPLAAPSEVRQHRFECNTYEAGKIP